MKKLSFKEIFKKEIKRVISVVCYHGNKEQWTVYDRVDDYSCKVSYKRVNDDDPICSFCGADSCDCDADRDYRIIKSDLSFKSIVADLIGENIYDKFIIEYTDGTRHILYKKKRGYSDD